MRIDLNCPYREKDTAKLLGARWDTERKTWYIVDIEDLTPFMRWINKKKKSPAKTVSQDSVETITLDKFLSSYYSKAISLTYKSAKAFGIPYPLQSGWAKKYANNTAKLSALTVGKVKQVTKPAKVITGKVSKPLCNCPVPPWEDCEHTEALAMSAMKDILS